MRALKSVLVFAVFLIFSGLAAAEPATDIVPGGNQIPKMPKITWDSKQVYVDGAPYFIRGIAYTGADGDLRSTPVERIKKDIELLKDMNVNTVRFFVDPPRKILDEFYKNGIMVIMQIHNNKAYPGGWTNFRSEKELDDAVNAAREQVKRDKDHPAILTWCAWNDGPFGTETVKEYTREEMESFLGKIVEAVRKEDPSRPVTCANMPGCKYDDIGAGFIDILGFNNYAGLHGAGEYAHAVTLKAFDQLSQFGVKHAKPVIITETGYSTISNPDIQGKVIKSLIDAARTRTTGICIFMFSDDWSKAGNPAAQDRNIEEYWGIVGNDRTPKNGYMSLKEAYGEIAKYGPEKAKIEPYVVPSLSTPAYVENHRIIEDFEIASLPEDKLSGIYTGDSEVKASVSNQKSWKGLRSLNVTYEPKSINTWGCAVLKFDKPIPEYARGISLWIYRDGSQNGVVVQIEDKDRDVWKDYSLQLGEPGWTYYVIDFNNLKRDPNGSAVTSNGVFDKGTVSKFIVVFTNVASQISSSIYVDDMEILY